MAIEWRGQGRFIAHLQKKDTKELSSASGRLVCAVCGASERMYILGEVRAYSGPTTTQGEVLAMVMCEGHAKPIVTAFQQVMDDGGALR